MALGLLAALDLSGQAQLREQVAELLRGHGLPTHADGLKPAAVAQATRSDKKRLGASVPFVLLDAPGSVRHGAVVSDAELDAALGALCG